MEICVAQQKIPFCITPLHERKMDENFMACGDDKCVVKKNWYFEGLTRLITTVARDWKKLINERNMMKLMMWFSEESWYYALISGRKNEEIANLLIRRKSFCFLQYREKINIQISQWFFLPSFLLRNLRVHEIYHPSGPWNFDRIWRLFLLMESNFMNIVGWWFWMSYQRGHMMKRR